MKKLYVLLLAVMLISCEKDVLESDALGENSGIVGTWIAHAYEDELTLLLRGEELDHSRYGFTIYEDGNFLERKNAGWCGTPPISYDNFEGTWEALSDSLLDITVAYWGGSMTYQMRIVSLDADELKIRYLYSNDRVEAR